jgi:hypothetical protein
MATRTHSYLNTSVAIKGAGTNPYAVDFGAMFSANITGTAYPGRVLHLNSVGEFELGASGTQVPIYGLINAKGLGVTNSDDGASTSGIPTGRGYGLVPVGGFEIQTTEYDKTGGVVYAVNDLLHAPTEAQITGDKTLAGLVYKTKTWPGGATGALTLYTDAVCGQVSRPPGSAVNQFGQPTLSYWTFYFPGTA